MVIVWVADEVGYVEGSESVRGKEQYNDEYKDYTWYGRKMQWENV